MQVTESAISRFWDRVSTIPEHGCWEWTGNISSDGYGSFTIMYDKIGAHRVSWEINRGPIPTGLCVLHRCDNPTCVNPEHLFVGTKGDNNRDRHKKGRDASGDANGSRVHIDRMPRGEGVKLARLKAHQIPEIRARRASGATLVQIAQEFGVSLKTIWAVCSGRTWRHV